MSTTVAQSQLSAREDRYRGAQLELIFRWSGYLSIIGSVTSLLLMAFYPPTVALGRIGWLLVVPVAVLSIVLAVLGSTGRYRPRVESVHASSFIGIGQIALLQWLAGGGKAPYTQLLILPLLGSGAGQSVRRCIPVVLAGAAAALSPLLYSSTDVLATVTEFTLLAVVTVMTASVISSTREHRARLEDAGEHANVLAHVDPLTGIPNRRSFDEALAEAIVAAERGERALALVLCDVNSFKQINDTFGHAAGDEVLCKIAAALADTTRRPDTAFRWAGDEFAVILGGGDEVSASRVAGRLRKAVARRCRRPDGVAVSLGTGVTAWAAGMDADAMLVAADRALFCQKARRKQLRGAA